MFIYSGRASFSSGTTTRVYSLDSTVGGENGNDSTNIETEHIGENVTTAKPGSQNDGK